MADRKGGGGGGPGNKDFRSQPQPQQLQPQQQQAPAPPPSQSTGTPFTTKPPYNKKVPVSVLKEVMKQVMDKELANASYQPEQATMLTKKIADDIRSRLKGLDYPRYKYMVQVVLGEQRGEGVRCGCRCFWDTDVDRHASETFMNENIFCMATVYAVYLY